MSDSFESFSIHATTTSHAGRGLVARVFNSGFKEAHDTYNGLSIASDGRVYYVLCSTSIDFGGRVFRYDPRTDTLDCLGDLTEMCGEKDRRTVPQGKSHVLFYEYQGKLYFSTHAGYYNMVDGMERMATEVPPGYHPYPGGHLLAYDLKSGQCEDLGLAPDGEAVLAMGMDTRRGAIYGITWPVGIFFCFDVASGTWRNLGPVSGQGESGSGTTYRVLPFHPHRPRNRRRVLTNPKAISLLRAGGDRVARLSAKTCAKIISVGTPHDSGCMGYHWRQVIWHPQESLHACTATRVLVPI